MKEQFPGTMSESNTEKMNETFNTLATFIEQAGDEDALARTKKAQSAFVLKKLREGDAGFLRSPRFRMFLEKHGFVDGFVDVLTAGGFDMTPKEQEKVHDWKPHGVPEGTQGTGSSDRAEDVDR